MERGIERSQVWYPWASGHTPYRQYQAAITIGDRIGDMAFVNAAHSSAIASAIASAHLAAGLAGAAEPQQA